MQRLGLAVALTLLAAGTAASWPALYPTLPTPLDRGLGMAHALIGAESWADRLLAVAPSFDAGLGRPLPVVESREIPVLVEAVYAHLGAGLDAEQRSALEAQATALPPEVRVALQRVLGAIELGMADAERAAASLTEADWRELLEQDQVARTDGPVPLARPEPAVGKLDTELIRASAARLLATLDAVSPLLHQMTAERLPVERTPLFPGPNEGILFNDPFNLILVGDVVPSTYRGNTYPFPAAIAPPEHILIIDLDGEDTYLNHPATARGGCFVISTLCPGGLSVSVVLDFARNDMYTPDPSWGSISHATGHGVAIIIDAEGSDQYTSSHPGANEAYAGSGAVALLLDGGGNDLYEATGAAQAYASGSGTAVLLDVGGSDTYLAGSVSQASGWGGTAVFADFGGDDRVSAGAWSQARLLANGSATFLNVGGNDVYYSREDSRGYSTEGSASFLDVCGSDTYQGWLGANDAVWQQEAGIGEDTRDAGMCAGNE